MEAVSKVKNLANQFYGKWKEISCQSKQEMSFGNKEQREGAKFSKEELSRLMGMDYERFSNLLPYRYFDEDDNLFINDQSIGLGMELAPLAGANEEIIHAISEMIKTKVTDDISIQVMMVGNNKVGDTITSLLAPYYSQGSMFEKLAYNKFRYLKHAAIKGFPNKRNLNLSIRDYRCFLFVSKRVGYSKREAAWFCDFRSELKSDLNNIGIPNESLEINSFLSLVYELVNPNNTDINRTRVSFDQYKQINEQCVSPNFFMRVRPDYLLVRSETRNILTEAEKIALLESDNKIHYDEPPEKTHIVSLSLKRLPDELALWAQADNFSNIFKANHGISCPFVISVHFKCEPQERSKLKAYKKASGYEKKANSPYAKLIPGTVQAAQDWKKIRDDLLSDDVKLCKAYFNCILFTNENQQKDHVSAAISAYRLNGFELYPIKYQQLQSYLSVLPFVVEQGLWSDLSLLGRLNTMTTWNLSNLLPLVAEYKGSQEEQGVFAPTFRHQASSIDFFSSSLDNYNACICATSGSGKSFLSQAIVTSVLSDGGQAWVIDLGESYKKFCETMNGTYMNVSNLRLNPFSGVTDIARSGESIRDLLAVMASPSQGLVDVQKAHLLDAVHIAFEKKKNNTEIDDVIDALQQIENKARHHGSDLRIDDIITLLKKFSKRYAPEGSIAARIFNEKSQLDSADFEHDRLVVLELGELEKQPDLLKSVLFALILHIEEKMYHGKEGRKKICVIDEAWRLLSGSNKTAAAFIEKGFRTARKHNGSFLTITQQINDFYASDEAKAAWSCAETKIIMRQNDKAFKDFLADNPDYFDTYQETLIKGFKESSKNGFSEFMVQQGSATSFHRLFVDPFSRVMYSSKASEHRAVENLVSDGMPVVKAIEIVAHNLFKDEMLAIDELNSSDLVNVIDSEAA